MDQPQRFVREVMTKDGILAIANAVSLNIHRALSNIEAVDLYHYARKQSMNTNWTAYTRDQMVASVAAMYITARFTARVEEDEVDTHESNKTRITDADGVAVPVFGGASGTAVAAVAAAPAAGASDGGPLAVATLMGKSDSLSLQSLFNPSATLRRNYIELDSRFRDTSQDITGQGTTRFAWAFQSNSTQNASGVVNSTGNVGQIQSISTGNLRIPYFTCRNDYSRVSLLVSELSGQSYIAQENRNYHFMFSSSVDRAQVDLHALPRDRARFEFARPITQFDTLTVTFADPHELITFDADRQVMTVGNTAPATFSSPYPHNLDTGALVYLSGFTAAAPADTTAVAAVNRVAGWNIVVTSATTFQIPVDLSTLAAPIAGQSVTAYFGSKRFFLPIEIAFYMH